MRLLLCLTVCLLSLVPWPAVGPDAFARDPIVKPERGSPLRSTLLDTARPVFEAETGGPIEFVVTRLAVLGQWAYGDVVLQRPGGQPLNWRNTKFATDYAQGMFDPAHNLFLLRNRGNGWAVIEYQLGPTDVAWDWWRQQHGLPRELFED